jgi:hypothetical protein
MQMPCRHPARLPTSSAAYHAPVLPVDISHIVSSYLNPCQDVGFDKAAVVQRVREAFGACDERGLVIAAMAQVEHEIVGICPRRSDKEASVYTRNVLRQLPAGELCLLSELRVDTWTQRPWLPRPWLQVDTRATLGKVHTGNRCLPCTIVEAARNRHETHTSDCRGFQWTYFLASCLYATRMTGNMSGMLYQFPRTVLCHLLQAAHEGRGLGLLPAQTP